VPKHANRKAFYDGHGQLFGGGREPVLDLFFVLGDPRDAPGRQTRVSVDRKTATELIADLSRWLDRERPIGGVVKREE
jgi:hypothetical protein